MTAVWMRRAALAAVATACSLAGAGCLSSSDDGSATGAAPSGPLAKGATFTYALGAEPGNLDPATNTSQAGFTLLRFAYDTLVGIGPDGEVLPALAKDWQITPKRVTFTLRDDVTCADGSPVTPAVVAKNLQHLKDPEVQSQALGTLDFEARGDEAEGTVTIDFGQPIGFPLQSVNSVPIVCGKGLRDRGMLERGTSGSGPYVLDEAVPNDHYTLTLRKDYAWGPDGVTAKTAGLPAKVTLRIVPNPTTVTNLLLNGQLDGALVSGAETARLRAAGIGSLSNGSGATQMYFNEDAGHVTADPAVREALTMAIDRADVSKVGGGRLSDSLAIEGINPCPAPAVEEALPAHDADAAAAVLERAGWREGGDGVRTKDGERLSIATLEIDVGDQQKVAAAELMKKDWHELGVEVKSKVLGTAAATEALAQGSWDVTPLLSITVLVPTEIKPFLSGPGPPDGLNYGHVENPDYDRLSARALRSPQDEACELWNEAEEALFARADVVPLIEEDVTGWHTGRAEFRYDGIDIVPTSIRMHQG